MSEITTASSNPQEEVLKPEAAPKPATRAASHKVRNLLIVFVVAAICVVGGLVIVRDSPSHKSNIPVSGKQPAGANAGADNPQTADAVIAQLKQQVAPPATGGATLPPPGPNAATGARPTDPIYDPLASPSPVALPGAAASDSLAKPPLATGNAARNSGNSSADNQNSDVASNPRVSPPVAARNNQSSFYLHGYGLAPVAAEPERTPVSGLPNTNPTPNAVTASSTANNQVSGRVEAAGVSKPPLGTLLPVRLLGALYTFRSGGLVRLQLTRPVQGNGWALPRGAVFVGRLNEGQNDRAFLSLLGYLDAEANKLVPLGGEVLGTDGAPGLKGERRGVGRRWVQVLSELSGAGVQLGSAYLLGRNGGGFYGLPPVSAALPSRSASQPGYVMVAAGVTGFIMVTDLPPESAGDEALGIAVAGPGDNGLADDELARLISDGTPAQIRAALPRMSQPLRVVAERVLAQEK